MQVRRFERYILLRGCEFRNYNAYVRIQTQNLGTRKKKKWEKVHWLLKRGFFLCAAETLTLSQFSYFKIFKNISLDYYIGHSLNMLKFHFPDFLSFPNPIEPFSF